MSTVIQNSNEIESYGRTPYCTCISFYCHTKASPWWIIKSDDKHVARREDMKPILNSVRYKRRRRNLNYEPDPKVVVAGDIELKRMHHQIKKYGKVLR